MVNWDVFFDNSSSTEALADFVNRELNFSELNSACWPAECKHQIKRMKYLGYKKSRSNAKRAMLRRGYC